MNKIKNKKKEWIRTFEVGEASKISEKGGHFNFQVTSWLFPMGFPEASTKLVTTKKYSDFQKLHKQLSQIHRNLYLSGTMPNLPKSGYFSRVDAKVLSERRQKCLEFLEFVALHPPLYNSQVFLNFFATTSPSSVSSNEEIGILMDQGQIMEAAIASTQFVKDDTPTIEPFSVKTNEDENEIVESNTENSDDSPNGTENTGSYLDEDKIQESAISNETLPKTQGTVKDTSSKEIVENQENISPENTDSQMPEYLNEAANVIKKAIECESEERFDESVACYRKAIGTLLDSIPKDKCLKRQASVKRRIAQYITKAEQLSKMVEVSSKFSNIGFPHLDYFNDVQDLKRYKMQQILGKKVILAIDTKENDSKVVIKVVQKTTTNSARKMKLSVLPINVSYMVNLLRYYETDEVLILVLEFVPPGCLFPIVQPYLTEKASKLKSNVIYETTRPKEDFIEKSSDENQESATNNNPINDLVMAIENSDDEEIESELLCINNQAGMEDHQPIQDLDRFHMLEDHANEIIAKRLSMLDPNKLTPNRLLTTPLALSSAPLSVPSSTAMSPLSHPCTPQFYKLCDLIPTFGGQELQSCEVLPMNLLKSWTVQLVKVVMALHSKSIYVQDLNPSNILLSENGQLTLTFQYEWISIENPVDQRALDQMYCAPEVNRLSHPKPESDWWSVGALVFELFTGYPVFSIFPSGMPAYTQIPWNELQNEAFDENDEEIRDLLSGFLKSDPDLRLSNPEVIKKHKFFRGIDWTK